MTKSGKIERRKTSTGESLRCSLVMTCFVSVVVFAGTCRADEIVAPSEGARQMTAIELHALYRDKSWAWSDGAGRFDDKARRFTARTGAGNTAASAKGRWIVTNDGRFCLDAKWKTTTGAYSNATCFGHRLDHGTIYQRKEPSGPWYIFKHAVPVASDEFKKLTVENLVSSDAPTTKASIDDQKKLAGEVLRNHTGEGKAQ